MDLNNQKWNIIHPPPNEESHPVTSPMVETVGETEELIFIIIILGV